MDMFIAVAVAPVAIEFPLYHCMDVLWLLVAMLYVINIPCYTNICNDWGIGKLICKCFDKRFTYTV